MNWQKNYKNYIKLNEPLKNKTTFRVGGAAKLFSEPEDKRELKLLIIFAKRYNIPVFVIGAGSNLLVSDKGVNGLVLKLSSGFFKKISTKSNCLEAGSAVSLAQLIRLASDKGLSGLEFLAGIPGTVGGALSMNAGAGGMAVGDLVQKVKVMDYDGNTKILRKKEIKFAYRKSSLGKYIILSCILKLKKEKRAQVIKNIKKYLDYRRDTQDTAYPNAGCIFKNPRGHSAGRLIDLCGLKGRKYGGACVSAKHANFILNRKGATAADILKLMRAVKKNVKNKFDIELEPEIKIWE